MNYIRNNGIVLAATRSALWLAVVVALAVSVTNGAFAGSATWKLNPTSGDWNTAANWTPETVPNDPSDIATFGQSTQSSVSISTSVDVSDIVFNAGASPFEVAVTPRAGSLNISGGGITNNSGLIQRFVAPAY